MPSNKDLIKEINELGAEAVTEGKNNAELAALLSELKASRNAVSAEKLEVLKGYRVCQGKSITTKKGVMVEGMTVEARDLNGGQESLDHLLNKGYLKK